MTWYAVAYYDEPDRNIWTLSRDPDQCGWKTDSGFPGYGLSKADAEFLAKAANDYEDRQKAYKNHDRT